MLLSEILAARNSCAKGIILRYVIILRLGIFSGWDYCVTRLVHDEILLSHGLLAGRDFSCAAGLCATGNFLRDSYADGIFSFTMGFSCSEVMARRDSCATGFIFDGTLASRDACVTGLSYNGIVS